MPHQMPTRARCAVLTQDSGREMREQVHLVAPRPTRGNPSYMFPFRPCSPRAAVSGGASPCKAPASPHPCSHRALHLPPSAPLGSQPFSKGGGFPISRDLWLPLTSPANKRISDICPEKGNWGDITHHHTHARAHAHTHTPLTRTCLCVDKLDFRTVLSPAAHFAKVTWQTSLILLFAFVLCKRQVAHG